jgi:hypothetical protein
MNNEAKELRKREQKARRELARLGYALQKSRVKNPTEENQGGYAILNGYSGQNPSYAEGKNYEMSIEDVEHWLKDICHVDYSDGLATQA